MPDGLHLALWDAKSIRQECDAAYKAYRAKRTAQYTNYFGAHSELKDPSHPYSAKDLPSALPDGWGELARLVPKNELHRHHRSGNSSQVLALGVLGVGKRLDPSLRWLFSTLGPVTSPVGHNPSLQFEKKLDASVLDEHPRQTSLDVFIDDPDVLVCAEAKWTEEGMGKCSCQDSGGNPAVGDCSALVRGRSAYWATLEDMGLPSRTEGKPCPLSFTYQCVRNVAAAKALATAGQQAVFALLYDEENPYFGGCGAWKGWPNHLKATIDPMFGVTFAACSWQELTISMPLDDAAVHWAREKHALDLAGSEKPLGS